MPARWSQVSVHKAAGGKELYRLEELEDHNSW